jgi:hypothetical protein
MVADANNLTPESVLLLQARGPHPPIVDFSTQGLLRAQFRNEVELNQIYKDARIVYRTGEIKRINKIGVLRQSGAGIFERVKMFFTRTKLVSVDFLPSENISLDELKSLIKEYIRKDRENSNEPFMAKEKSLDQIETDIDACENCAEIFLALQVSEPIDCLDTL